jgi:hypothetical protein
MNRDFYYESSNIGYDNQYTEKGIKCKNYILCETILPKWWYECKGNYLCTNCHVMFGTWKSEMGKGILEITNNIECPICLETKQSISQPRCNHSVCISCFKRCYYGEDIQEPMFPYPEIEDEYYDDIYNIKWNIEYPLIKIYNEELDKLEDERDEKYEKENNLRKCPICRK